MTRGSLIFAFNNEQIDYLSLAAWSTKNIHRHLNIPVCVVTNVENIPANYEFDQIVFAQPNGTAHRHFADLPTSAPWYNGNRTDAYALSPWDTTLVLDADYVVASDQLDALYKVKQDFLCHRWSYDITNLRDFNDLNYFGKFKMPMWWATVMLFHRSKTTELIFDSMNMIKEHWGHYKNLYGTGRSSYRNDYALSIAANLVNGHTLQQSSIPWRLATLTPDHKVTMTKQDCYRVDFNTSEQQARWIDINAQDFHAMGKGHLGAIVANS